MKGKKLKAFHDELLSAWGHITTHKYGEAPGALEEEATEKKIVVRARAVIAGEPQVFDVVGVTAENPGEEVVQIELHHDELQHRHNDLRSRVTEFAVQMQAHDDEAVREAGQELAEALE